MSIYKLCLKDVYAKDVEEMKQSLLEAQTAKIEKYSFLCLLYNLPTLHKPVDLYKCPHTNNNTECKEFACLLDAKLHECAWYRWFLQSNGVRHDGETETKNETNFLC